MKQKNMGGHSGHDYNLSMNKTKAKGCEFKTSLVYIRKLCLKHNKKGSGKMAQNKGTCYQAPSTDFNF